MQAIRTSFLGLTAAGAVLCGAAAARADGPMVLTPRQLDRVTAGSSAIVISSTDAQASGVVSLATTTSNSVVTGGVQPFAGQPNLTNTGGAADGTALAVGTNLGFSGNPAPSTGTSVVTAGAGLPLNPRLVPTASAVPSAAPPVLVRFGCPAKGCTPPVTTEFDVVVASDTTPEACASVDEITIALLPAVTRSSCRGVSTIGPSARAAAAPHSTAPAAVKPRNDVLIACMALP